MQLSSVIQATMSRNNSERDEATKFLFANEQKDGFVVLLLRLISMEEPGKEVRQAAAAYLKNTVHKYWDIDACDTPVIAQSDRETVKQHIISIMLQSPPSVQRLLSETVRSISEIDFHQDWESLLPEMLESFNNWDKRQMNVILETMVVMFHRYSVEAESEGLWIEIKYVVDLIGAPLLEIMKKCCEELATTTDSAAMTSLMSVIQRLCQLFYLLCYQEIPQVFVDSLGDWMGIFLNLLKFDTPLVKANDTSIATPVERTKASICQSLALFVAKYEEDLSQYIESFVMEIWSMLTSLGEEERFDSLVSAAIMVLDRVVQKNQYKEIFGNMEALSSLCEKVILPQIKLRESDLALFEFEGLQYVRIDMEGSNSDTRRKTAMDFIRGICKYFEKEVTDILKNYIKDLMGNYESNPAENWWMKDVAMYVTLALSVQGSIERLGATKLNEHIDIAGFFSSHVITSLDASQDVHDIIRADALKFITVFRSHLPLESYSNIIDTILPHLKNECYVVHTYAAAAIEKLLSVKDGNSYRVSKDMIQPIVGTLLDNLFQALNHEESAENEYIIKAVFRVCSVAQDHMTPHAANVIEHVSSILTKVAENPRFPRFTHFLFETISCLIRYICAASPEAVTSFEAALFDNFQKMLSMESCQEFAPYIYQLLSQLLLANPTLNDTYKGLYRSFIHPNTWASTGNITALVDLMSVYIIKDDGLVAKDLDPLLGVFQLLLSKRQYGPLGLSLLTNIIEGMPLAAYANKLNDIFAVVLTRLKKGGSKDRRFARVFIVFCSRFILHHSFEMLLEVTDSLEKGMMYGILDKVWIPNLAIVQLPKERNIVGAAMVTILCKSPSFISAPYLELWPQALDATVGMVSGKTSLSAISSKKDDQEQDILDLAAEGFKTTFVRVSNAVIPSNNPVKDLDAITTYLAQSIAQLTQDQPQFVEGVNNIDPKNQKRLEDYLNAAHSQQ